MAVYKETRKERITNDGRSWYYVAYSKNIIGVNKRNKSKYYSTKKEAQEAERLFLMKRDNPIRKPFSLIAKDYFEYMYRVRKESTVYSYENNFKNQIEPFFEHFYISDINISTINKWKEIESKKGLKTTYLNKSLNILSEILDYAVENYGLNSNPVRYIKRFEIVSEDVIKDSDKLKYITKDEFDDFIKSVDDLEWKTFFMFLFYTGMRKGEVQALSWNDIDLNKDEIIVNKTLSVKTKQQYKITNTKNYINRTVKINKALHDQLLEYKNHEMKYVDYSNKWFVFGGERFLPQTTIDRYKHLYFEKSGIKEITIHEFRHSHVSLLINEYIKAGQTDTTKFFIMMSNRMGHSIKVMQETYMHLFPSVQNEIVDLLDNL